MYSNMNNSSNKESYMKSVGPYRFQSTGHAVSIPQISGTFGPVGTITIISPVHPAGSKTQQGKSQPSKEEDFRMLIERHKETLELLAK